MHKTIQDHSIFIPAAAEVVHHHETILHQTAHASCNTLTRKDRVNMKQQVQNDEWASVS